MLSDGRGDSVFRWECLLLAALGAAGGCAHHHAQNSYAYAPPYAAPVYPQPQSATQPVMAAAPVGAVPAAAMPAGAVVGGPVIGGPVVGAPVVSGIGGTPVVATQGVPPCPQIPGATLIGSSDGGGGVVLADGQTPPCPPSP